jgi:hypothetical protein
MAEDEPPSPPAAAPDPTPPLPPAASLVKPPPIPEPRATSSPTAAAAAPAAAVSSPPASISSPSSQQSFSSPHQSPTTPTSSSSTVVSPATFVVSVSDPEKRGEGIGQVGACGRSTQPKKYCTLLRRHKSTFSHAILSIIPFTCICFPFLKILTRFSSIPLASHFQYVTYKVTTTPTSASSLAVAASVVRRYNDFVWLRARLVAAMPHVLVPPLPDKQVMGRFHGDFIQARRRGLAQFMQRVALHRELSVVDATTHFLHHDDAAFAAAKRNAEREEAQFAASAAPASSSSSSSAAAAPASPTKNSFMSCT